MLRLCGHPELHRRAVRFLFFHKPAVLFGQVDFHHQMQNVAELGQDRALSEVKTASPAFDQYLHWFIHQNSIKRMRRMRETGSWTC